VRLENGRLLAHLQDDLIVLDELHFSGPPRVQPEDRRAAAAAPADREGSLSANGRLRLGDFSGVIQVAATHLPLLQRPDRWVIASGGGNIETSSKHIQVNGAFAADAGFVGIARAELPSLSDDVVVVRAGEAAEGRERRVALGFDLGLDLGNAFFLTGKGLNTRVEGALRLRSAGRGAVTAVGSIEAVDGVYEGFGQKLKIARGRINFQGAPENPGLDILALRGGLPVEVGVTITRTAAAPLVRMHSDPPMSDAEALSWLVLGRAPDQGGGENIALAQAAAGLLSGASEGYPTRVARAIGVDEISIRSGTFGIASLLPARGVAGSLRSDEASAATVAGEIITIAKNINDALTLSYEQAISDTTRFLQLNYRLSERLSVVARGGTDNALDLVYSFAFD
jgi:translocation and assembly module TamB